MHSKPSGQGAVPAAAEVDKTQADFYQQKLSPSQHWLPVVMGVPRASSSSWHTRKRAEYLRPCGLQERLEKEKRLTSDLGRAAAKLQELLKTTQEQLTKEKDTVKKLQEQLEKAVSAQCRLDHRAGLGPPAVGP